MTADAKKPDVKPSSLEQEIWSRLRGKVPVLAGTLTTEQQALLMIGAAVDRLEARIKKLEPRHPDR